MEKWREEWRNNKAVFLADSHAKCEGRVQIKRRKEDLDISQSDFFNPLPFAVSAGIFCQKVMETPV